MIKEFRAFIDKGNFLDIAVGFVMGAAFTAVVSTFTDRIINPAIGLVFNLQDLDQLGVFGDNGSLGAFMGAIINFLIVGLFLFFVVRSYNRLRQPEESAEDPGPSEDILLLREIRDSLSSR
jgi:large conductance mechanosensitive channel